jgi:hypothetical protein
MLQATTFSLALLLALGGAPATAQSAQEPPATPPAGDAARAASAPRDESAAARALLERAIAKQLGSTRDHVLRSFQTEISLVDQRQGNVEARLAIAFAAGAIPAQDGIKIRTRLGDEVETSRWGAQYWISRNTARTPMPMTQAEFQKDRADLWRYAKMCRTLMHALSLAGLAHSLQQPRAKEDVEVDWFDGSRRKMAFVIEGLSTEIGGLLAETEGGANPPAAGAPGTGNGAPPSAFDPLGLGARAPELAEVRLHFNAKLELERIDVRRATKEGNASWQAYRFLEFAPKDVGGRRYVTAPSVFHVYEALPVAGTRLEHALQVRLVTLRLNPTTPPLDKHYFENRGFDGRDL